MTLAQEYVDWFTKQYGDDVDEHPDDLLFNIDAMIVPGTCGVISELRWSNIKSAVYRFPDESFIQFTWSSPATEYQDGQPYDTSVHAVVPRDIVKTIYVPIDGSEYS